MDKPHGRARSGDGPLSSQVVNRLCSHGGQRLNRRVITSGYGGLMGVGGPQW
jgi:hypothetical protein